VKKILLITVNIVNNSPQPIRFRNLIREWKKNNKITVLTKDNPGTEERLGHEIEVIKVPYSRFGKVLISVPSINTDKQSLKRNKSKKNKEYLRTIWKKIKISKFIFPDKYIFEQKSFQSAIVNLLKEQEFDNIIISAYPFSMLKLAQTIHKHSSKKTRIIYDIGDPFYGNSVKFIFEPFHSLLSKRYESKYLKYIDDLVVISSAVKNHYHEIFGKSLENCDVHVIEQGINPYEKSIEKHDSNEDLRLVYAGGFYKNLREPFELYKALEVINDRKINLRIFGNIYRTFLPDLSSKKYFFGGSISQIEVMNEFSQCDIIVFIDNAFGIQVPGKILEVISVKKPILFIYENENSPTFEFIMGYNGVVYVKNNKKEIFSGIHKIINSEVQFDFDYDISKYYWEKLAKKYAQIF